MERLRDRREPQGMTATRSRVAGCLLLGVLAAPAAAVPITFSYTGGFQSLTLTEPGDYRIVAAGAAGGGPLGGFGARAEGIFTLNGTETLSIIVGGRGDYSQTLGYAGGGGGSFGRGGLGGHRLIQLQFLDDRLKVTGRVGGRHAEDGAVIGCHRAVLVQDLREGGHRAQGADRDRQGRRQGRGGNQKLSHYQSSF